MCVFFIISRHNHYLVFSWKWEMGLKSDFNKQFGVKKVNWNLNVPHYIRNVLKCGWTWSYSLGENGPWSLASFP